MFCAAGVNPTGPATYSTDELAVWLGGPNAENKQLLLQVPHGRRLHQGVKGRKAPGKKSKALVLQAAIDDAGGVLPRAGAGGAMSVVGLMHAGCTSGSARGVLPAKAALSSIETLRCGLLERARRAVGGLAKTAAIIDRAPFG